jgi:TonB family protein
MPKLGSASPPQQAVGKPDQSSTETVSASEEPMPPPKAPALPGPKVLAGSSRADPLAVKETTPDSLVQLPTKESSGSATSAAQVETTHRNAAGLNAAGDNATVRALKEGAQIPGALKGTGSGAGPYGVPGGSRAGTGLSGGGTGSGTGGGSSTGLRGISNADYNQYLKQVERRVNSVWRYPDDVSGVQKVTVRFTLDRAGKLSQAEVLESSDARINASALEAMRRASPFPPIPETLKDLAGEPLIIRFTVAIRLRG